MNVKLLREIAQVIQESPAEFDMTTWHYCDLGDKYPFILSDIPPDKRVGCGTTHCIAGWAQVLSPNASPSDYTSDAAGHVLGLSLYERERLFYAECWPHPFRGEEDSHGEYHPTAEQAAARIEHFIATDGRE